MPLSFWILLCVCIVSFIPAIDDHGEAWAELKEARGTKRWRKLGKIFALWFVAIGSLIGTLVLGFESCRDSKAEAERDRQYEAVTNDLAIAKRASQPRHLGKEGQKKLFNALKGVPVAKMVFNIDPHISDAQDLAGELNAALTLHGFTLVGVDRMTFTGGLPNHGIAVSVRGQKNSDIADAVIKAFNAVGLNAHPAPEVAASAIGTSTTNFENGVLYINIGDKN